MANTNIVISHLQKLSEEFVCVLSLFSRVQFCAMLWTPRFLCPRDAPGKNIGVGFCTLLQGIFLTEGSNPRFLRFLHWQAGSVPLLPPEKEYNCSQTSNIKSSVFLLNSIELFYFHSSKINIFQVLSEKLSSHPIFHLTSIKHPHRQSLFSVSGVSF